MKKVKNIFKQLIAPFLAFFALFAICPCCSRGAMFNLLHTLHITSFWAAIVSMFRSWKFKILRKRVI